MLPIAITPGEPAGIGPDIVLRLIQEKLSAPVVIIADPILLQTRAKQLNINVEIKNYNPEKPHTEHTPNTVYVLPTHLKATVQTGELNPDNASYVLKTLDHAIEGCQNKQFSALVTGPVHKGIINDAGFQFSGHTEYLGELTHSKPVMMLATHKQQNNGMRVALATTHLPLSKVSENITQANLEETLLILHHDLQKKFGIAKPQILVCGLNPHAGENGHLGNEEIDIIEPVLEKLVSKGLHLTGPLPADTLFTPKYLNTCDAVLAMYHDQGLPVLKYAGFGEAVNITLGLPIIRTSVDHGTALDLAGSGKANHNSLAVAFETALELARLAN